MPKPSTANSVQQHTEAKLEFYTRYLKRYLAILLRAKGVGRVNLYDLFCGEGQYSDGNTGSAVRAVDAIWEALAGSTNRKQINLHLNDLDAIKVNKLEKLLATRQSEDKCFSISYSSLEAAQLLQKLIPRFAQQPRTTRNLVFIDPYGYKEIDSSQLKALLEHGRTEIVLFLPIEQMYRFRTMTIPEEVENPYKPLQKFIRQFELDASSISSERGFIRALEEALKFGNHYYATSYYIKNHTGHNYGMFFITSNLLGLQKIVEVKWTLDDQEGQGYSGKLQRDFVLEFEAISTFGDNLRAFLGAAERTNIELYEFVIQQGFLPKHANEVLKQLCKHGELETVDLATGGPARKNSFKLSYEEFKTKQPCILYRLRERDNEQN